MRKTTVYMEEQTYRQLKQIARAQRRSQAELIRAAVAEYTAGHALRRNPRSIGTFRSSRPDLGQRANQLLGDFGKD
jgi:hypothetical protein